MTCFSLKLSAKNRANRVDCWLQVKKRDSKEEKTRIEENRIIKISFLSSTWKISQNMSQAAELLSQKTKTSHFCFNFPGSFRKQNNFPLNESVSLFFNEKIISESLADRNFYFLQSRRLN